MISQTALTSTPTEDEATRAAQFAQEKLKAEKARKKRLARERAKAHEEAASRQQDQMYYGYAVLDAAERLPTRRVPANGSLNRAASCQVVHIGRSFGNLAPNKNHIRLKNFAERLSA